MNIVPDVIIPFLPAVKNLLAPDGKAILSGIIEKYVPDIENALARNSLKAIDSISENDWVCITVSHLGNFL
jgi:ribosomal protein L11 methylase PrmA